MRCILNIPSLVHSHWGRLPHLFNWVNLKDFQLLVLSKRKKIVMLARLLTVKTSAQGYYCRSWEKCYIQMFTCYWLSDEYNKNRLIFLLHTNGISNHFSFSSEYKFNQQMQHETKIWASSVSITHTYYRHGHAQFIYRKCPVKWTTQHADYRTVFL